MGRVQYYFATKDDLLLHALGYAHRRMEERIEQRLKFESAASARTTPAPREQPEPTPPTE